jgi:hypothetical protein
VLHLDTHWFRRDWCCDLEFEGGAHRIAIGPSQARFRVVALGAPAPPIEVVAG